MDVPLAARIATISKTTMTTRGRGQERQNRVYTMGMRCNIQHAVVHTGKGCCGTGEIVLGLFFSSTQVDEDTSRAPVPSSTLQLQHIFFPTTGWDGAPFLFVSLKPHASYSRELEDNAASGSVMTCQCVGVWGTTIQNLGNALKE